MNYFPCPGQGWKVATAAGSPLLYGNEERDFFLFLDCKSSSDGSCAPLRSCSALCERNGGKGRRWDRWMKTHQVMDRSDSGSKVQRLSLQVRISST